MAGNKQAAKWKGKGPEGYPKAMAFIAVVGVIAIILGSILQSSGRLVLGRTPHAENSPIRFSELMSENGSALLSDTGEAADWIEIENTSDQSIDLHNYSILLGTRVKKIFSFPKFMLEPHGFVIVTCDGTGNPDDLHAPFKLAASGGETLTLIDPKGNAADMVTTPELSLNQSYCRIGQDEWVITSSTTPGETNIVESAAESAEEAAAQIEVVPGALEITEVMSANTLYYPDSDGETNDYIEIHNRSGAPVNLDGWCLSDSIDKLKRWSFPSVNLPPDGYIVVWCSGKNRTSDSRALHSDFKLSREGETVFLTSPDGVTVSKVDVPALERNQAYSLSGGVWNTQYAPTPWLANTDASAAQLASQMNAGNDTGIVINEIMASPTQQSSDWIELHNTTNTSVDLSGWGLSDDASKPRKYQFPSGTVIGPGEYMGIFMSSDPAGKVRDFLNTGFALSMDGGYTMSLSAPDGRILESVYVPQQYAGISYGRVEGRNGYYFFENGTPGTANSGTCYSGRADTAKYSVKGGLFTTGDTMSVELSAPEGSRIYYTLDCTDPDQSSTLYTGPIEISSTTILRTRVYCEGWMPSYMDTQSYLYDVNNGGNTVFVVSLVSDPYNLFSDEAGIMVKGPNALEKFPFGSLNKGANFWMDWEREAHVELYTPGGEQAITQECGIKLHGQYSRACTVKGIKVIARSKYGKNTFSYPIFSNRPYKEYQSFVLRASGQDYNLGFMRDSLLTALARNTSVMYMETEIGVVFINGVYYSMMYIRERINTHSICQFEGWQGQEDDLDLIKANRNVMQGSNETYANLLEWLKSHDPSTQEAYDKIDSVIDIQNYIEYMAMEIFVGNGDTLNVKRYRNPNTDGKWRWVLFDLDWAFWVDTNSIARWLDPKGMGTNKYTDTTLFIACIKNPIFRDQFLTHFGQRLATDFSSESMVARIEKRYGQLQPILPDYLERINQSQSSYKKQLTKFVNYAKTRPTKILTYFDGVFKFTDADKQKYFGEAIEKINSYQG